MKIHAVGVADNILPESNRLICGSLESGLQLIQRFFYRRALGSGFFSLQTRLQILDALCEFFRGASLCRLGCRDSRSALVVLDYRGADHSGGTDPHQRQSRAVDGATKVMRYRYNEDVCSENDKKPDAGLHLREAVGAVCPARDRVTNDIARNARPALPAHIGAQEQAEEQRDQHKHEDAAGHRVEYGQSAEWNLRARFEWIGILEPHADIEGAIRDPRIGEHQGPSSLRTAAMRQIESYFSLIRRAGQIAGQPLDRLRRKKQNRRALRKALTLATLDVLDEFE